jgi:hypothetical protein
VSSDFEVREFRSNGLGYEGDAGCMGDIDSASSLFYKPEGYQLTKEEIDTYCSLHIRLVPRSQNLDWFITHQGDIEKRAVLELSIVEFSAGDIKKYEQFKAAELAEQEVPQEILEYFQNNLINSKLEGLEIGKGKVKIWACQSNIDEPFTLKNARIIRG